MPPYFLGILFQRQPVWIVLSWLSDLYFFYELQFSFLRNVVWPILFVAPYNFCLNLFHCCHKVVFISVQNYRDSNISNTKLGVFTRIFDCNDFGFFERYKFNIGSIKNGEYIRYLSAAFLHANFTHLFFNLFTLYMFANVVVAYMGSINFLIIYFISLFVGNFLAYFFRTTFCLTSSLNNVCECNQCIEDDFYRLHWQLSDKLRPKVRVFYLTVCYQLRNSTLWWFCVWLFLCLIGVANLNSQIHLEGTSQNI